MTRELHEAFGQFEADARVPAIVVNRAGKYFSAGRRTPSAGGSTSAGLESWDTAATSSSNGPSGPSRRWMRTPVIAAMNGSAVGMGIDPAGQPAHPGRCCDAKIGFALQLLRPRASRRDQSWTLAPAGRRVAGDGTAVLRRTSGRRGRGDGPVLLWVLPAEEAPPAAQEFARDLAANTSAVSVAATKELVYDALGQDREESHTIEHGGASRCMGNQADARA